MKYLRKVEKENDKYTIKYTPNLVLVNSTKKVLYNITPTSVFIQHINGTIYTTAEWTSCGFTSDDANGVAVIDDNARFVIAKEDLDNNKWSSDTKTTIAGIPNESSPGEARKDYGGLNNTTLMLETDTSGAGYSCANYSFPNGQKGYLGAAGEWWVAYTHRDEIDEAMSVIGASPMNKGERHMGYWTSTQYPYNPANNAWTLEWRTDGSLWDGYGKSSIRPVRPFTTIEL